MRSLAENVHGTVLGLLSDLLVPPERFVLQGVELVGQPFERESIALRQNSLEAHASKTAHTYHT